MTDVDLRFALLERAQDQLNKEWDQRNAVEEATARFAGRAPVFIRQPTLHKVLSVATKLYNFVTVKEPLDPDVPGEPEPLDPNVPGELETEEAPEPEDGSESQDME